MEDYKAKYNNALERVRDFIEKQNPSALDRNIMQEIFPEIKESEDDRISREITEFILTHRIDEPNDIEDTNHWLAWLEKQGEKPKWSEKDEEIVSLLQIALDNVNFDYDTHKEINNWLKSIRERIGK